MTKFRLKATGTILHTDNEAVIQLMTASDAYERVEEQAPAQVEAQTTEAPAQPKRRAKKKD